MPGFDLEALDTAFARMNDAESLAAKEQTRAALRLPNGAERGVAILTEPGRQSR